MRQNDILIEQATFASVASATLISRSLLPRLATHRILRVIGVHPHALNLLDTAGEITTITSQPSYVGPFHLLVPEFDFAQVALDQRVEWRDQQLCIATQRIDLSQAIPWNAKVDWSELQSVRLSLCQSIRRQRQGFLQNDRTDHEIWQKLLVSKCAILEDCIARSSMSTLATIVKQLAGLGPGLTPSGDDVLLGVMAGLWMEVATNAANTHFYKEAIQLIANEAAPRTSRLSAMWLNAAAIGEFGVPWHDLAGALASNIPTQIEMALKQIANIGASSGLDALLGLETTLQAVR